MLVRHQGMAAMEPLLAPLSRQLAKIVIIMYINNVFRFQQSFASGN